MRTHHICSHIYMIVLTLSYLNSLLKYNYGESGHLNINNDLQNFAWILLWSCLLARLLEKIEVAWIGIYSSNIQHDEQQANEVQT